MPDIIHLLPDNVANQIAAGEVVQRPSSVVKELLENAIDAQATHITLNIKEAGKTLIQVIDNGIGMSTTDARMAFERHATSKIQKTEDIFNIHTKGFRGEALASIAAVSQVELKTQKETDDIGTQLIIEANQVIKQEPIVTPQGSSFAIKNLFYNVPARRKFLKSNNVEFKHILNEFFRVALAHPSIQFDLYRGQQSLFKLRKGNLAQRIIDIFGKKTQNHLLPIQQELSWINITGYVGKPEAAKKSRNEQYLFANHRFFKSGYFHKAILNAFEGLLPSGYNPSYFIFFEVNPEMIDVNIHPSKTEIKFEKESDIFALLLSLVKQSIGVYNVAPSLDFEQDTQWQPSVTKSKTIVEPKIKVNPTFNPFENQTPTKPTTQEKINLEEIYAQNITPQEPKQLFSSTYNVMPLSNGYWLWEHQEKIWQLDLYRIHQTVIYNQIVKQKTQNAISQQLLFPTEIPIAEKDKILLQTIEKELISLGFELDYDSEFVNIHAVPTHLQENNLLTFFEELLANLDYTNNTDFYTYYTEVSAKITAKKKNEWQNSNEVHQLLETFIKLDYPNYSPFKKRNYQILEIQPF